MPAAMLHLHRCRVCATRCQQHGCPTNMLRTRSMPLPLLQVLCECLVYACCIRQRLPAADVADLADLLHRLGLKARANSGADLTAQQQVGWVRRQMVSVCGWSGRGAAGARGAG